MGRRVNDEITRKCKDAVLPYFNAISYHLVSETEENHYKSKLTQDPSQNEPDTS